MRWPFAARGADVVLSVHEHNYERLIVDGIPYFVNGLGGDAIYPFVNSLPESQFRYYANYRAMRVNASQNGVVSLIDLSLGQSISGLGVQLRSCVVRPVAGGRHYMAEWGIRAV